MKNRVVFMLFAIVVAAASVAHARTRRTVTVVNDTVVSPLDGYACQVN